MALLRSLGGCLISTLITLTAAVEKPPERDCTLRLSWWVVPEKEYALYLLNDKEAIPLDLARLSVSQAIPYKGKAEVVIAQKEISQELDKNGKPKESWIPYATFKLKAEDVDVAVFLLPDEGKDTAKAKSLDLNPTTFPYGSAMIVNYTQGKVACNLGGGVFFAESGEIAHSPKVYAEQTAVPFALAVLEANGAQHSLRSTQILINEKVRFLYILLEVAAENASERYQVRSLSNFNRQPTVPTPNPAGKPGQDKKTGGSTDKKMPPKDSAKK
jgi:hypothetical protein